jgi:hypothetical protein
MPTIYIDDETSKLIEHIQEMLAKQSKKATGIAVLSPPNTIIKNLCKKYLEK